LEGEHHNLIVGGRFQTGNFTTFNTLTNVPYPGLFVPVNETVNADFQRWSLYGYSSWELLNELFLTGGLAYDNILFPRNHRQVPIGDGEARRDQIGPKAALLWIPLPEVTLRGVYTRSLGGVSF